MSIFLITGPIASGKSRFARRASEWFCAQKRPVKIIELDTYGKKALKDSEVISHLVENFGKDIVVGGEADARLLASCAFVSPDAAEVLNQCTHPTIYRYAMKDVDSFLDTNAEGLVLIETPFPAHYLKTHGFKSLCERATIIVVDAPKHIRLLRCVDRFADARKRDDIQYNYGAFSGDFTLVNDSDEATFDRRIDAVCASLGDTL